jgi:hypothetical protein
MKAAWASVITAAILLGSAAAASAETAGWYECNHAAKVGRHYIGEYTDKTCTQADPNHEGRYELRPGTYGNSTYKAVGGTTGLHGVIPGKGDIKVTCDRVRIEGGTSMPDKLSARFRFQRCKALGAPCSTAGTSGVEEIETETLTGHIGWIEPGVAGVRFEWAGHPGAYWAEWACQGLAKTRIWGTILATLPDPGETISKEIRIKFAVGDYLGEPAPGYRPLTNPSEPLPGNPEEPATLRFELNGSETGFEWAPADGLPGGFELDALGKFRSPGLAIR